VVKKQFDAIALIRGEVSWQFQHNLRYNTCKSQARIAVYDNYPQHDVPQNNVIQRFFAQRWSAIVIEILMTIVITVATGRAFDIFNPFDSPQDAETSFQVEGMLPSELTRPSDGFALRTLERKARQYIEDGQYAEAVAMLDLLSLAKPEDTDRAWYLEIAQFYDTLGESRKASLHYERYFELVGKNADLVAQSDSSLMRGAD